MIAVYSAAIFELLSVFIDLILAILWNFGKYFLEVAGGGGFEPPLWNPESHVLPLDDPPELHLNNINRLFEFSSIY